VDAFMTALAVTPGAPLLIALVVTWVVLKFDLI
jgi:hypothetical protein